MTHKGRDYIRYPRYKYFFMKNITDIISPNLICDLRAETKDEVLVELCNLSADAPGMMNQSGFLKAIKGSEKVMSTGLGMGIAIPHARTSSVSDFIIAIGRTRKGIDFESLDGAPVYLIILLGAPVGKRDDFLKLVAKIGSLFIDQDFIKQFLDAKSPQEMYNLLVKNYDKSV